MDRTPHLIRAAADSCCPSPDAQALAASTTDLPTVGKAGRYPERQLLQLPCGQLALALAGALCGPMSLRTARDQGAGPRARIVLDFEHPTVGRLELAVGRHDDQAHHAIRAVRSDPNAYTRLLALLACALELDGAPGRFTYEAVHRLTHGPRPPTVNRARLNQPVEDLLYLLSHSDLRWTPPRGGSRRPAPTAELGALLSIAVHNRKARTVTVAPTARPLLTRYALQVTPEAFGLARPTSGRRRPPAPVLARLRLAALIAARWRGGRRGQPGQRIAFGDILARFAWLDLDHTTDDGAADAASRTIRPRLRETTTVLADELRDPLRYGAGLLAEPSLADRAPLRTMLALAPATRNTDHSYASDHRRARQLQPTLEEARLRAVDAPPVFPATEHSIAEDHSETANSIPHGQLNSRSHLVLRTPIAATIVQQASGRVTLELADGTCMELDPGQAASLSADSIPHGQDSPAGIVGDSLARDQRLASDKPGSLGDSIAHDHGGRSRARSAPGFSGLESSSDDSDRTRAARLSAALTCQTTSVAGCSGVEDTPRSVSINDLERRSA